MIITVASFKGGVSKTTTALLDDLVARSSDCE